MVKMISVEKAYRLELLNQRVRAANSEAAKLQGEAQIAAQEFSALMRAEGLLPAQVVVVDPGKPFPVGAVLTMDGQPVEVPDPPAPARAAPAADAPSVELSVVSS